MWEESSISVSAGGNDKSRRNCRLAGTMANNSANEPTPIAANIAC